MKDILNGSRIAPWKILSIQNIIVLAAVFAVLVGMLYLFDNETKDDAETRRLETISVEQNKRIEHLASQNVVLNERQIELQNQAGNISEEARARIINNLEVLLPTLNQTIQNIDEQFNNHTQQVMKHDQSLKGAIKILEVPQSNFTAQKLATERIANITEDTRENREMLQQLIEDLKGNPYLY